MHDQVQIFHMLFYLNQCLAFYERNKEELKSIGKVVKTHLSRGVAKRFLSVLSNPPLLGYHGTAARNQSNILNNGFLI